MPTQVLYDPSQVDLNRIEFSVEDIRRVNPQRYEFEQLTAVNKLLKEEKLIVGHRLLRSDEFWVRGHIPGNPIFPGVLMLECAAQLCAFYYNKHFEDDRFVGFGGVDKVRFRGTVVPGDRLIMVAKGLRVTPRMSVFATQGFVKDRLVFEAEITGVAMS